ncbi:MAG: hypothetical protein EOP61_11380 [Sphingomonadales bacterium]|nr:MAG: hypothetical protein EOP61_11380 [Sphingomonadales bacterium]
MREMLGVAAAALLFAGASPVAAQTTPTLKVDYVLCQPEPTVQPDGTRTAFYHNAVVSNGKLNGLAASETRMPGTVAIAADAPFKRGTAVLEEQYKIAYPSEAKPHFEREFRATFPAADGARLKGPFLVSYFVGGVMVRQGTAKVSASTGFKFSDTIPEAEFLRMKGQVKVTLDGDGGGTRIADIEFNVPALRTRPLYESSFQSINIAAVQAGTVPAGCRKG